MGEEPIQEVPEEGKEALSHEQEEILAKAMEEMAEAGVIGKSETAAEIEKETLARAMEEMAGAEMGVENEAAGEVRKEEAPEAVEEPAMEVSEEEAIEEQEQVLPSEQENFFTEAVEKEAEEAALSPGQEETPAYAAEPVKEKKKSLPFVMVSIILGVLLLFGGLVLFYFYKARESKTILLAEQAQETTITEKVEVKNTEEILQELASEEVSETEAVKPPLDSEVQIPKAVVSETAKEDKPEERTEAEEKPAAATAEEHPAETDAMPEKEDVSPPAEPAVSWKDLYTKGMTRFQEGNLNGAFKAWSDVIRSAPEHTYSIQIEITSYLNYASRDIKESSPDEDVFIVTTLFKDKPAYKVLCGIYEDRSAAEKALQNLSAYLKAQKPALVKVDRLKQKLVD
jgi:tetratricopeptide (TPR) repeat protein